MKAAETPITADPVFEKTKNYRAVSFEAALF